MRLSPWLSAAILVGGLGALWALSRPDVRGTGPTASIDGEEYVLRGADTDKKKADKLARRIRAEWRKKGIRGSVRVLRKTYRGTATLWTVYERTERGER